MKSVHIIIDVFSSSFTDIQNHSLLELLHLLAKRLNMTVLGEVKHEFTPQGFTALLLLAESHISIHTWPEHGHAAMDIFTCGASDFEGLQDFLTEYFPAGTFHIQKIERGSALHLS